MELQFTSKNIQILIDCVTKYYSATDIRSLGRNLAISETEYFNPMATNRVLADEFISRVFQLSKQNELLNIIINHPSLKRKSIVNDLSIIEEVTIDKICSINILHLSDIHLGTIQDAKKYRLQINTDLALSLKIEKIDFMVLSGDISNHSTKEQYSAAVELIESIIAKFNVDRDKIIIVPGNHDLSWAVSKKSSISSSFGDEDFNEETYKMRFDNFNEFFYKKIFKKSYPCEYSEQGILYEYEKEKIIFLGLNSAWQIDHINKYRASIYVSSLDTPLDKIMDKKYHNWLKVAVFHHPVTGKDSINNDFLQILIRHNFKACMHGHIHEAKYDFCSYGTNKEIAIIGAGTFGAPDEEHVIGIPLQYNLIQLGIENNVMRVTTRRKEKSDGAWEADARWGDKDKPDAFYDIDLLSRGHSSLHVTKTLLHDSSKDLEEAKVNRSVKEESTIEEILNKINESCEYRFYKEATDIDEIEDIAHAVLRINDKEQLINLLVQIDSKLPISTVFEDESKIIQRFWDCIIKESEKNLNKDILLEFIKGDILRMAYFVELFPEVWQYVKKDYRYMKKIWSKEKGLIIYLKDCSICEERDIPWKLVKKMLDECLVPKEEEDLFVSKFVYKPLCTPPEFIISTLKKTNYFEFLKGYLFSANNFNRFELGIKFANSNVDKIKLYLTQVKLEEEVVNKINNLYHSVYYGDFNDAIKELLKEIDFYERYNNLLK